jgi:outer membrane protein, heavy metal efflux system
MFLSLTLTAVLSAGMAPPGDEPPRVATGLTRRQAVDEARARNPAIFAAREQVEEARARVTEATAIPDPTFAATLEEEKSFFRPRTATSQDIGIGLTLPFPERLRLKGRVATGDLRAAEFSLQLLIQQTISQTNAAYDALLVALRHREDLQQGKALADDFLKRTDARYQGGMAAKFDVLKAKVDVAQAENSLIANDRVVTVARAALNRLLGRAVGAPTEAAEALDVPPALPPLAALESLSESSRPELQSLQAQREAARSATSLARKFWIPDVNLTLSRNFTQGDPPAYSTAVGFALPLFFWQHEKGEIAEARHREIELSANYSDQLGQVALDVRTAYSTASTALRQALFIRDELLPEARESYRIASTSYSLGGLSALELLDAKRTLLDAESQYADALGSANDARADLERAVGAPLPAATSGDKS